MCSVGGKKDSMKLVLYSVKLKGITGLRILRHNSDCVYAYNVHTI